MLLKTAILITGLMVSGSSAFSQTAQTLTGTVSDTMCGAKHMMPNVSAAQCTRECVKQGSDYGLVSGAKVYTLKGDAKLIDKFAGQKVIVKGNVSGATITVSSIVPAKS
jgi:hypothetical protein